jgi:ABC-type multidrug transport system fused ATPase/permease subunit
MSDGRIAAIGSHAELLRISPDYRTLYEMQFHHAPEMAEAVTA